MYDHGLFAAGIVHTIAPRARLHLIEVLNHQGIGTLETIARGLEMLVKHDQSRPLIVNCSLMVDVPLLGQPRRDLKWDLLATDCELMKRMGWPLEWICDELGITSGRVVAAAGNDGEAGQRPGARYLAAFGSVLGVGALNHDRSPAEYSNFSDTPVRSGIATFGGNAGAGVADPHHGVLGIYTAAFPPSHAGSTAPPTPQPNTNGWARWAGTSFATPVVSGVLAALCGQGKTLEDARQILEAATVTMSAIGSDLPVRQGP
jgi:hypothetical protein